MLYHYSKLSLLERGLPFVRDRQFSALLAALVAGLFLHTTTVASEHLAEIDCDDEVCLQCHVASKDGVIPANEPQAPRPAISEFKVCLEPVQLFLSVRPRFRARAPPPQ